MTTTADIPAGRGSLSRADAVPQPRLQRAAIRGLSVQQPFGSAIAHWGKDIENRTRIQRWRGWVAIHAPLKPYPDYDEVCEQVAELAGIDLDTVLAGAQVRGKILAVANLTGSHGSHACVRTGPLAHLHPEGRYACSRWAVGGDGPRIHLQLANVMPLPEPVPCRGRLMFWQLPDPVLAEVVRQLPGGRLPDLPDGDPIGARR